MTFAKAVKSELRAAFGPKWIASAVQFAVVLVGLAFVGVVGIEVAELAGALGDTIANVAK